MEGEWSVNVEMAYAVVLSMMTTFRQSIQHSPIWWLMHRTIGLESRLKVGQLGRPSRRGRSTQLAESVDRSAAVGRPKSPSRSTEVPQVGRPRSPSGSTETAGEVGRLWRFLSSVT